ncbi:beta-alanine-activating enzyme beta-propeller domain-containing protein [Salinarchaeum laminariae]|uniref:beta-alanine-activating enzyme beta-propeller domain-containing protein n=1 Tax=Salinarchaeum laminariae TaxID=869888 RepID=UPI0020C00804|nr:PQQ-binding-like beta-propeller repeat protein [Salinarchaeum laminariae]
MSDDTVYPDGGTQTRGWQSFRADAANTGVVRAGTTSAEESSTTPTRRWATILGPRVQSSPAIVDGTVYVGSWDGCLYALDAHSGDIRWETETDAVIRSSPAVADSLVANESGAQSPQRTVYVGGYDDTVYALDAATGECRWTAETDDAVFASPAIAPLPPASGDSETQAGVAVYIGSWDGTITTLDPATGETIWSFDTGKTVFSSPAVVPRADAAATADEYTAFVGDDDGMLYALDAALGESRWHRELDGQVRASPAVAHETVYVGTHGGTLHALEAASGEPRWRADTDGRIWSSAAVTDDAVYVGSYDNNVYAFNPESGERLWTAETGAEVFASPAVDGDTVYVGSWDTHLYAFDAHTGDVRWRYECGDGVYSSPAVTDDTIYVGCRDGTLHAIGLPP